MNTQEIINRAKNKLKYLSNLQSDNSSIVKKVNVDKNDPLVKRLISRITKRSD